MFRPASLLIGALVLLGSGGCAAEAPVQSADELWNDGLAFEAFLEAAESRTETWHANWQRARVSGDLLDRARAVPGAWRMLVVAEDWCGDSANTVPYLARLASEVPGLELRIVDSRAGRGVMDRHRTPDDRRATPTVVLLDEAGREAGCWIERPAELQRWWLDNPDGLDRDDQLEAKYAWYDEDAGASTVREIVERLEAAASGALLCEAPAAGGER